MPVILLKNSHCSSGGIEGEAFRRFLQICLSFSTSFSLSAHILKNYERVLNSAEKALEPFQIKTLEPCKWFGYPEIKTSVLQTVYKATASSIDILSQNYLDLFLRNTQNLSKRKIDTVGNRPKYISKPCDLCFWNHRTMIVGTLSHEQICATNNISDELCQQLSEIAEWEFLEHPSFGIDEVTM